MVPQTDPTTNLPYTFPASLPNPSRPMGHGVKTSVAAIAFDAGFEQRRIKAPPKRTWDCQYLCLTQKQFTVLRDFFLKVQNCYAFYWTDPVEKIRYTCRFDMDTLVGSNKYHGPGGPAYEVSFKLVEAF